MKRDRSKTRSFFDAVQLLDAQDDKAKKRLRDSHSRRSDDVSGAALATTTKQQQIGNSQAAQSQDAIYRRLLEARILLQRSFTSCSTLGTNNLGSAEENEGPNQSAQSRCNDLLVQLLTARRMLTASKKTAPSKDKLIGNDDDAAAAASDYRKIVEASQLNEKESTEKESTQLSQMIAQEYADCRDEWQQVLDRRYAQVRLHSGIVTAKNSSKSFRVVDMTFWQQIESNVQHEMEERARTTATAGPSNEDDDNQLALFDDTKVYQQLVKDFLATATPTNTVDAAARQAQLLKKNHTTKRKDVDRRASKGRKVRYHEIPKLVNFTFPFSRSAAGSSSSHLDEEEWFSSLFGGAAAKRDKAP